MIKEENAQKIIELWKDRNEKEFSWVKQVLSVLSILLGLLISLKSDKGSNTATYISFVISITLNGLCILFGLIFLYAETDTIHSLFLKYLEHIESPSNAGVQTLIQVTPKKIYGILRICFLISLVLSILSLVAFGIISSFPSNIPCT